MVIEWLVFKVPSEAREKFIEKDREIWSANLDKYPGFLSKEIWINPEKSDRVTIVIRWQTREHWKAVPLDILVATEQQFALAMGKDNYQMIEASEYQIRKFT